MRIGRTEAESRIGTIGILRERDRRDLRQLPLSPPILDFGAPNLTIISEDCALGPPENEKNNVFLKIGS